MLAHLPGRSDKNIIDPPARLGHPGKSVKGAGGAVMGGEGAGDGVQQGHTLLTWIFQQSSVNHAGVAAVQIPGQDHRGAAGNLADFPPEQFCALQPSLGAGMVEMGVEKIEFVFGGFISKFPPAHHPVADRIPAPATRGVGGFRKPEGGFLQQFQAFAAVKNRTKFPAILPVITADAIPVIFRDLCLKSVDLRLQCLLNTHHIRLKQAKDPRHPANAVRPGVNAVAGIIVADIERHRSQLAAG